MSEEMKLNQENKVMKQVDKDSPLMIAWEKYKATADYANTKKWALFPEHVDGSLWASFLQGYEARLPTKSVDVDGDEVAGYKLFTNTKELLAVSMAYNAHKGQKRKYTNEPYITHPIAVAGILKEAGFDEDVICAALLHDSLEDTQINPQDIKNVLGEKVLRLVQEVTDVSKPSDGNRRVRKELDRQHIAKASYEGKSIKLADLIHNTSSIVQYDPGFAEIYLHEKIQLLDVLQDGHHGLFQRAVLSVTRKPLPPQENQREG